MGGGGDVGGGKGGGGRRYAFKVLCPNELIARVLGSRGARKDQMQEETGCKISVSGRDEYFPGTRLRTMVIWSDFPDGPVGVLERLVGDVVTCAAKDTLPPGSNESDFLVAEEGQYILRAAVTRAMSSAIIGTRGSNVRAIREESGAKVAIDTNVHVGHQIVKLVAEPVGLRLALVRINRFVQETFGAAGYDEWAAVKSFDSPGGVGPAAGSHGKGAPPARERSPRRAPAPARERSPLRNIAPPPPPIAPAEDDTDVDPSLLQALGATAQEFPLGSLEMEYTINCELPREKVGSLIGKRGEDIQRIRKATGTWIRFEPPQDGVDGQTLTIKGPLLKTYRAHALLMRRYHETQAEGDAAAKEMEREKERQLEEQLKGLQRQLDEVTALRNSLGGGPHKGAKGGQGKGSRKGR